MTFQKGQVANPRGRHTHRRNKLTDRFIKELDSDFRAHGADAVKRCREEHPEHYLAIVAKLAPKHTDLNVRHDLSERFINAIRNAAMPTSPSVTVLDMKAETVSDGANPLIPHDTQRSKDTP